MAYNPENASETTLLPPDAILDGKIKTIEEGKVEDFVKNLEKWQGDTKQTCINIICEVKDGNSEQEIEQLFTYNEKDGKTTFAPGSNLAKYKKKYGNLPKAEDKIKISSNNEGFGKIKLD